MTNKSASMKKVLVGVPTHSGDVSAAHADALSQVRLLAATQPDVYQADIIVTRVRGGANIPRSRNVCVAAAAHNNCDAVFFVDADTSFNPDDFFRLLHRPEPVACGGYMKRPVRFGTPPEMTFALKMDDAGEPVFDQSQDLLPLQLAPTGFMRINMSVFAEMRNAGIVKQFCYNTKEPHMWPFLFDYFAHETREGRASPETEEQVIRSGASFTRDDDNNMLVYYQHGDDYCFSERCNDLDIPMYMDPLARVVHWQAAQECWVTPHHVMSADPNYRAWLRARVERGDLAAKQAYDEMIKMVPMDDEEGADDVTAQSA